MKITTTEVVCDVTECTAKHLIEQGEKFPYNKGWIFLYSLNFQLESSSDKGIERIKKEEHHFCCKTHLREFVLNEIDKTEVGEQ